MADTSKHRKATILVRCSGRHPQDPDTYEGCFVCDEPWPCEASRLIDRVAALEAAVEKLKNPVTHAKRHSPYDCSVRRHIGERRP
jgi:hypothetical protein